MLNCVTALFALAMTASGVMNTIQAPNVDGALTHLGYPVYLATLLGMWKLLGVLALLFSGRRFPRLREWAYAGFFFDFSGAVIAHRMGGDGFAGGAPAAFLLVVGALSYAGQRAFYSTDVFIALGATLGATIPYRKKPLVDLLGAFDFPELYDHTSASDRVDIWQLSFTARTYVPI